MRKPACTHNAAGKSVQMTARRGHRSPAGHRPTSPLEIGDLAAETANSLIIV